MPAVSGPPAQVLSARELEPLGRAGPIREAHEDNGGFIHAASLGQAQAGAVLRNGYLSRRPWGEGNQLAIDLSSDQAASLSGSSVQVKASPGPNVSFLFANDNPKISKITPNKHFQNAVRDALD